ncbi:MAG: SinI family restriction endonuclease [Sutterellaceae bacterium]|nr:SinI family restriction endonuclease [Sutterellaceae bacterium]
MCDENKSDSVIPISAKFQTITDLLKEATSFIPRGKSIATNEGCQKMYQSFLKGRDPKHPSKPSTVTDEAYLLVMYEYFGFDEKDRDHIVDVHTSAMGAENIVGDLLERYLASVLEPHGWVWCSGSVVRAVDFARKHNGTWQLLQVKNRDNSENSSSAAIREKAALPIKHWYRTFSKKHGTNWENFPFPDQKYQLSEESFRQFVKDYMDELKQAR